MKNSEPWPELATVRRRRGLDVSVTPWPRAEGTIEAVADGSTRRTAAAPWVTWEAPRATTAMAGPSPAMLDDFLRLGRITPGQGRGVAPERWQQRALQAFLKKWGPWGACRAGHQEPPWRPHMVAAREATVRSGAESVESIVDSAQRVNALRRIVAKLRAHDQALGLGRASDPPDNQADWLRVLEPEGTKALPHDEWGRTYELVDRWLQTMHVTPAVSANSTPGRTKFLFVVGGVAGALAVAFADELANSPRVAICGRCGITWYVRRDWVGIEDVCGRCQATLNRRST